MSIDSFYSSIQFNVIKYKLIQILIAYKQRNPVLKHQYMGALKESTTSASYSSCQAAIFGETNGCTNLKTETLSYNHLFVKNPCELRVFKSKSINYPQKVAKIRPKKKRKF